MTHRAALFGLLVLVPAFAGCLDQFADSFRVDPYDYIRDDDFQEWIIEIDYVEGHRPAADATNLLQQRMESLVQKDTVRVIVDDAMSESQGSWSSDEIFALRDQYQDRQTGDGTVVTWVGYLDGQSSAGSSVLGVAQGYEVVAMFDERIEATAGFLVGATAIEEAVLVHEFGHIIGLVNNGIPMVTDREAQSCNGEDTHAHSTNEDSVMYCAVATDDVSAVFGGPPPTQFDANDRQDVCNAGGRC